MKTITDYLSRNQFVAALALIALGLFLFQIKEILIIIFVSYILMAAIHPAVGFLERRKWPRLLSISVIYLVIIAIILLLIVPIIPFFVSQIQNLIKNFPFYFEKAAETLGIQIESSSINSSSAIQNIGNNLVSITSTVFGGIISFFTIIVISFYLLVYHDRFEKLVVNMFHENKREKARETFAQVENSLGNWVRGQLILSVSIGIISWIFLSVLGINYAFPLAFLAAILEVIPTIGPVLASIPAIIVALTISPTLAIVVTVGYIIIQALENNILVPKIMQTAVGLNPIVIIIAILVGGSLLGVWGALISIPFLSMLVIILTALND
ncbi:MAG: AI-2E family transporter [Patescibacteria group bacterium]